MAILDSLPTIQGMVVDSFSCGNGVLYSEGTAAHAHVLADTKHAFGIHSVKTNQGIVGGEL